MEVRLRLQRAGKSAKKRYNYRIVAIAKERARESRHLELLGYYDPAKNPAVIKIDQEKVDKWLANGAQMSDTVKSLVNKVKREAASK